MARYIDAEELKKYFPHDEDWDCPVNTNSLVCELIDAQPTADVDYERGFIEGYTKAESDIFHGGKYAPVKHGHWIERESGTEDKENGFETVIVCSHCDFPATTFYSEDCESRTQIRTDFCPNCGAKMDEEAQP